MNHFRLVKYLLQDNDKSEINQIHLKSRLFFLDFKLFRSYISLMKWRTFQFFFKVSAEKDSFYIIFEKRERMYVTRYFYENQVTFSNVFISHAYCNFVMQLCFVKLLHLFFCEKQIYQVSQCATYNIPVFSSFLNPTYRLR